MIKVAITLVKEDVAEIIEVNCKKFKDGILIGSQHSDQVFDCVLDLMNEETSQLNNYCSLSRAENCEF